MTAHPSDRVVLGCCATNGCFRAYGGRGDSGGILAAVSLPSRTSADQCVWAAEQNRRELACRNGGLVSPFLGLRAAVATVHVRAWTRVGNVSAYVMLAASREEEYAIRERVVGPLTARGIDRYFLENSFCGLRRYARGLSDVTVADHRLRALGILLEAETLLELLRPCYSELAVAGYSMEGHMAAIAVAVAPLPVACAALPRGQAESRKLFCAPTSR